MLKRITFLIILAVLASSLAARIALQPVLAQDPTIPTRTPTPDPNRPPPSQPSPTPSGGGGGGDNSQPTATPSTDQPANPSPTSTSPQNPGTNLTPVATTDTQNGGGGASTSQGGIPGDDACDETPYILTLSRITVHAGPGIDYPVVTTLEKDEIRPIIGRAGFTTWWQIQVRPRLAGWVLDEEVNEIGNTALVPIVEPPMLNGVAPTPGAPWNPTPAPFVPCSPVATSTPEGLPAETATVEATVMMAAGSSSDSGDSSQQSAASSSAETAAEGEQGQVAVGGGGDENSPAAQAAAGVSERGLSASLNEGSDNSGSSLNLILPLAGIALIAAGILVALLTRTRSGSAPADSTSAKS